MASILGVAFGFYLIYAIFALIFKHKAGLIITGIMGIITGISVGVAQQNYSMLIGYFIGIIVVALVKPIQIRKG